MPELQLFCPRTRGKECAKTILFYRLNRYKPRTMQDSYHYIDIAECYGVAVQYGMGIACSSYCTKLVKPDGPCPKLGIPNKECPTLELKGYIGGRGVALSYALHLNIF